MHTALLASACVASSALCSWLVATAAAPAFDADPAPASSPDAETQAALDALRAQIEAILTREELASVAPGRTPGVLSASVGDAARESAIEEVVRRLVASDALVEEEALASLLVEELDWPGGTDSALAAIRAILDGDVDGPDATALWAEAAENGQLHELLAAMEEEMEGVPESAEKHFDRARAYYAAARAHPGNVDGNWWVDSNDAYSKALEHDPYHWDARYAKARNMAFWPVAYGGQAEAIRHFETLVDQQGASTDRPEFAKTYWWLGNLYDQQGRSDDARVAWEKGLALFPGDPTLIGKLASLGGSR